MPSIPSLWRSPVLGLLLLTTAMAASAQFQERTTTSTFRTWINFDYPTHGFGGGQFQMPSFDNTGRDLRDIRFDMRLDIDDSGWRYTIGRAAVNGQLLARSTGQMAVDFSSFGSNTGIATLAPFPITVTFHCQNVGGCAPYSNALGGYRPGPWYATSNLRVPVGPFDPALGSPFPGSVVGGNFGVSVGMTHEAFAGTFRGDSRVTGWVDTSFTRALLDTPDHPRQEFMRLIGDRLAEAARKLREEGPPKIDWKNIDVRPVPPPANPQDACCGPPLAAIEDRIGSGDVVVVTAAHAAAPVPSAARSFQAAADQAAAGWAADWVQTLDMPADAGLSYLVGAQLDALHAGRAELYFGELLLTQIDFATLGDGTGFVLPMDLRPLRGQSSSLSLRLSDMPDEAAVLIVPTLYSFADEASFQAALVGLGAVAAVPEPAALLLWLAGLAGLARVVQRGRADQPLAT